MAITLIAGLASAGSAWAAAGFALSLSAAFGAFAIGAGLSLVSRALMPKPDIGSQMGGRSVTAREAAHSRKIVYGRARIGGNIVYLETTGDDHKYLWLVVAVAGHEIDAYESVWFNDKKIWGDGNYFNNWGSYVQIGFFKGDQTTADNTTVSPRTDNLVNASSKWTDDHKLLDTAYMVLRLEHDVDKFAQGLPNISTIVRGKKVFDPDPDVNATAWSDNPALCAYDYLRDTKYGLGETVANILTASVITAKGVCNQTVDLADDTTQARYTTNGVVDTANSIKSNIEQMLGSMIGRLVYSGGQFEIHAGAYVAPAFTVDESVAVGEITVQTKQSRRSAYNGVKGVFLSEDDNYILADYPAQLSTSYATADGDPIYLDMALPFTTNNIRAQRIAKLALFRSRQQESITIPCNLSALRFKVGENINVTNTRLGYSNKIFEVVGYSMAFSSDGQIVVNVDAIETAASIWAWATSDEEVFLGGGEVELYDGTVAVAPTSINVTSDSFLSDDGTFNSQFNVAWTNADDAFTDHYVVEWKLASVSNYFSQTTKSTPFSIVNLVNNASYNVRVKAVNEIGVSSAYLSATPTSAIDTTAPSLPSSITATAGYKSISLAWTYPSQKDFNNVEIWRSATPTGTYLEVSNVAGGFGAKAEHLDGGLGDATAYSYKFKSVDLTGNKTSTTDFNNQTPATQTTNAAAINGSDGKSTFTAPIFKRASSAPSAPSGGTFNFGTNTLTAPTGWVIAVPSGTDPIYQANFQFSISGDTGTVTAGTWSTPVIIAENGDNGTDGLSTFTFAVHKRASSTPSSPSGGSYNFGTNTITAPSGWTETIPSGTDPIYISSTKAQISGATGTDSSLSWTAPIVFAINGDNGGDGVNTAPVYAYKRSSTALASTNKPTTTRTWTFADASFGNDDLGNGWTGGVPSGTDDLYICAAVASSAGATDSVVATDWSAPQVLGVKGDTGGNGVNTAVVYGYKRSASTVTDKPSTTRTWTFSAGTFDNNDLGNSFTGEIPSGTNELYVSIAVASSVNSTDSVTGTSDWSAPQLLAAEGTDGYNTAVVYGYKRSSSTVTDKPSTTRTWTFSTASFNNNDLGNSFTAEIPSGTDDLYACTAVARSQSSTDSVAGTSDWSAPQLLAASGDTGAAGVRNASGYVYYSQTSANAPSAPTASAYNFSTGAFTSLTSNWSRTPPVNTGGDAKYWATSYYVTEATYNGTQTLTFGAVFNSVTFDGLVTFTNLNTALATDGGNVTTIDGGLIETNTIIADQINVTNLAAISANMGTITAGSISVALLTGDVTEVYPLMLYLNTVLTTTDIVIASWSLPAPSLSLYKRQKLSFTAKIDLKNTNNSTPSTNSISFNIEKKSKGVNAQSIGTVTLVSFSNYQGLIYVSGNKLGIVDGVGGIGDSANPSNSSNVLGVYYDSGTNRTYINYGANPNPFTTGDTCYYSDSKFTSAGDWVTPSDGFSYAVKVPEGTNSRISMNIPIELFFGTTNTATDFRIRSEMLSNIVSGQVFTVNYVRGTMENIA